MIMPAHYAVSEALVALMSAWTGVVLMRRDQRLAAAGVALFGLAAVIGTVRFSTGLVEPLAQVHRLASQTGGLLGFLLLLMALASPAGLSVRPWVAALGLVVLLGLTAGLPMVGPFIVVAALVAGAGLAATAPGRPAERIAAAVAYGLMLPDVLIVRNAHWLDPAVRWHVYHAVIALWLALLPFCLGRRARAH
jgi:hypothetical protein